MGPLGMKPIHYVIRLYPDRLLIDVIRTLKEDGADLNAKDKFGDRPMHLACCRKHPVYALAILEQNGANALHFLFCPYSECTEFENIYKSLEFLLEKNIDMNQKAYDGNTPKDYAKRKYGKLNSMLWKLTATLKQDAVSEIKKRARTRRLSSSGAPVPPEKTRPRRRSVADLASVKSDFRV